MTPRGRQRPTGHKSLCQRQTVMQTLELDTACPECAVRFVDVEDELVCPSCGMTQEKLVMQAFPGGSCGPGLSSRMSLGSYMGSRGITSEERRTRGITGTGSNYEYLKVLSDFAGRKEGAAETCARIIERVGQKLCIPSVARLEAASIARRVLATGHPRRRVTLAAVSAYSLVAACKVEGLTSLSIKEIIDAHSSLGKVTFSSIIQLTLESPVKTFARNPEDYLTKVVARLSMNRHLAETLAREGVRQTVYFASLRETARELLKLAGEDATAGRRPNALAGSAIYSAELAFSRLESRRKRLTHRDIAECGDTAEYTIREQCANVFAPLVDTLVTGRMLCRLPPGAG